MDYRRDNGWDESYEAYSENQVAGVIQHCGIVIDSETATHFLCLCPFHSNTDSPAMAVDKSLGLFTCFSPVCGEAGKLEDLPKRLKGMNIYQTLRLIAKYRNHEPEAIGRAIEDILDDKPEYPSFSQEVLDRMKADFPGSKGEEYMRSRGFDDLTLSYFDVGFSAKKNMVVVPMHDPEGNPVGIIGRTPSHTDKRFKNSINLPKSKTAWNFHRAKRAGGTVIICEASYDAMKIHQAGYPNVIALLGGHITDHHVAQISRNFSTVIIMTDFDKKQFRPNCKACKNVRFTRDQVKCVGHRPGRELGHSIVNKLSNKKVLWAAYDETCVYPRGVKDASDMTETEIAQCLRNAVSTLEYELWNPDHTLAA